MSITREQFDQHWDELLLTTNPRGWKPERSTAYFSKLKGWDIDEFVRVCNWMTTQRVRRQGMTAFPELAEFFQCRRILEKRDRERERKAARQEGTDELASCEHCHGGYVHFEKKRRGVTYESYAACDCVAGNVVASHMVLLASKRARQGVTMDSVRYSHIFAREGGLQTAENGQGLMIDKPVGVDREKIRKWYRDAIKNDEPPRVRPEREIDREDEEPWEAREHAEGATDIEKEMAMEPNPIVEGDDEEGIWNDDDLPF